METMELREKMQVILVDQNDTQIGVSEKRSAHMNGGVLHSSFSILLFDKRGDLLMQQRSGAKYHTPLRWANTCCSHPKPGESVDQAVQRRLVEELGERFDCEETFSFIYRADVGNNMVEHEFNHVYFGIIDRNKKINFNRDEINAIKWASLEEITADVKTAPSLYTPWFQIIITKHHSNIVSWLGKNNIYV